ncbi:MAG: alkaline ceramidase, partial [Chloroflexota bacterium]
MAYRAGAATIDITPPVGTGLVGYHRAGPAIALLDRLYATVLVLEHANSRVALVNIDHAGMLVPHVTAMRQRLGSELGIPPAHVMVLFTHTHSGPQADDENELARAYRLTLEANLIAATREAARRLRPCTAAWGVTAASIGVNRRQRGPGGKVRMGINPHGPVDRRVGVLALYEAGSGYPVALAVICTAHANVLRGDSAAISADFPGVARRLLRGATGCPILIGIGAAGNVNARWRSSTADLERMGQALAGPVLALLPGLEPSPDEALWIGW